MSQKPDAESAAVRRGRFIVDGLLAALGVEADLVYVEEEVALKKPSDSLNKDRKTKPCSRVE